MANNRFRSVLLLLALLAASFAAGGWFFTRLAPWRSGGEVADLYSSDGESFGIFDNVPPEDLAAAEAVAAYSLGQEIVLPEDKAAAARQQDGSKLPSQIVLTDFSEIASVAPRERDEEKEDSSASASASLALSGEETVGAAGGETPSVTPGEDSKITLLTAPVSYQLIRSSDEYKTFKTRARGSYPSVNFDKQMLVVLESDSNLPDKIFELDSASVQDGKLVVSYRVNVFGLDKKINTHTVLPVDKTDLPLELKQVL